MILVASDLHAHDWPRFATVAPNGVNSRFAALLDVLDQIQAYAVQYQPSAIVLAGDLFHRKYFVRFAIFTPVLERLCALHARWPLTVLVGNHDYESHGVHALAPLAFAGITVVDTPTWRMLDGVGLAYMVPWMPTGVAEAIRGPVPMRSILPSPPYEPAMLLTHYALDGTPLDTEYQLPSPLTLADCAKFPRIVMGHIHRPALSTTGRVHYLGAVMHHDFGDVGARYCWLLDRDRAEALPLRAPQFLTTKYPRIGAKGFSEPGYLRVLGTPRTLVADVQARARQLGWDEVLCVEAPLPTEAVRMLTSGQLLTPDVLREYVAQQYPDLDDDGRLTLTEAGLEYLRRAEAAG